MNAEEPASGHRSQGNSDSKNTQDQGTYIAFPLRAGGYRNVRGESASKIFPALRAEADDVYKSQSELDKHVLSEKHRADSSEETPHVPQPTVERTRMSMNPALVASISIFVLLLVAAVLVTVLLKSVQGMKEIEGAARIIIHSHERPLV